MQDEIAAYMIDKMQTKTFPVISDFRVGFILQNIDDDYTSRYISVLYEMRDYTISIEYNNEQCKIEQVMNNNIYIFEDKGNYSLLLDQLACIALEESGNIVFLLRENKWSKLFEFEDVIKYYGIF